MYTYRESSYCHIIRVFIFCAALANGDEVMAKEKTLDYVFGKVDIKQSY